MISTSNLRTSLQPKQPSPQPSPPPPPPSSAPSKASDLGFPPRSPKLNPPLLSRRPHPHPRRRRKERVTHFLTLEGEGDPRHLERI